MASVPIKISKIGFCNFKFEDGQIPEGWEAPSDISNHYGIEFSFEYSWDGSNCYITNIQSEPIELDNTRTINRDIELQSIEFKNDKCLTIDFNSTSFVNSESEFDTTIYGNEPKIYLGESESLEYEVTNSSYMLANFKYENRTQNGNEEDGFSTVIYYIDIPNIKIPKPSKYENNVVFTEEGVKELVGEVESKVSKDGDTMTGRLEIEAEGQQKSRIIIHDTVIANNNNQHAKMGIGYINEQSASESAGRHGLFSYGYGSNETNYSPDDNNTNMKWMVYREADGNIKLNGNAITATGANLITTSNAIAIYNDAKGTFSAKATANGAAYATGDNESLTFGTLPVAQGGTGVTTLGDLKINLGLNVNDNNTRLFVKRSGDTMSGSLSIYNETSENIILNKNGNTTIKGTLIVGSTDANKATTLNGNLTTSGNATINGTLIVGSTDANKATTLNGNLTTSGNATINGTLIVGSSSVTKNTTLNGNLTISNSGKLILNNTIYGTDAPTAATGTTPGQIYFQLVN